MPDDLMNGFIFQVVQLVRKDSGVVEFSAETVADFHDVVVGVSDGPVKIKDEDGCLYHTE